MVFLDEMLAGPCLPLWSNGYVDLKRRDSVRTSNPSSCVPIIGCLIYQATIRPDMRLGREIENVQCIRHHSTRRFGVATGLKSQSYTGPYDRDSNSACDGSAVASVNTFPILYDKNTNVPTGYAN